MNVIPFIITVIGGIIVLLSYYIVFKGTGKSYLKSDYWLGQPSSIITIFFIFQILAVIGFLMFMASPSGWLFGKAPQGGILGDSNIFYVVLILFFLSSASWAFLAKGGIHGSKTSVILCSVSLVITAICSIIFIAGAVEEDNPRWFVVLGTILLGITTILGDGVCWNAVFLKKYLK